LSQICPEGGWAFSPPLFSVRQYALPLSFALCHLRCLTPSFFFPPNYTVDGCSLPLLSPVERRTSGGPRRMRTSLFSGKRLPLVVLSANEVTSPPSFFCLHFPQLHYSSHQNPRDPFFFLWFKNMFFSTPPLFFLQPNGLTTTPPFFFFYSILFCHRNTFFSFLR